MGNGVVSHALRVSAAVELAALGERPAGWVAAPQMRGPPQVARNRRLPGHHVGHELRACTRSPSASRSCRARRARRGWKPCSSPRKLLTTSNSELAGSPTNAPSHRRARAPARPLRGAGEDRRRGAGPDRPAAGRGTRAEILSLSGPPRCTRSPTRAISRRRCSAAVCWMMAASSRSKPRRRATNLYRASCDCDWTTKAQPRRRHGR